MGTMIMGRPQATAEQLRSYMQRVNPQVPAKVLDMLHFYLDEGQAEGVRGDIAFCQSCLETGNFTFQGSAVTLDQNNFAGIGVTSNGMTGNSWDTPQLGIRAQIQHLKAYGSTEPLVQECVDDRFKWVKRNSAPFVEWLGRQENPLNSGWAAGKNYGNKILAVLGKVLQEDKEESQMLPIQKMLTTKRCYVGENNPKYIVIHETDNYSKGAGARTHARAMQNGNLSGTVHYYVDDREIYQTLDHRNGAYAVGTTYGASSHPDCNNRNSINIEICVNPDSNYTTARKNCIDLVRHLIQTTGIPATRVIRHYDAKAKWCPRKMMDNPSLWTDFKNQIQGGSADPERSWTELGDRGQDVQDLQDRLNRIGYTLDVDGIFGQATDTAVRQFQTSVGIAVDGQAGKSTLAKLEEVIQAMQPAQHDSWTWSLQDELNRQYNAGLDEDGIPGPKTLAACITVKPGARGNITKLIQQRIGADADGIWGSKTTAAVKAFQAAHGLDTDAIIGRNTWKSLLGM